MSAHKDWTTGMKQVGNFFRAEVDDRFGPGQSLELVVSAERIRLSIRNMKYLTCAVLTTDRDLTIEFVREDTKSRSS